MGRVSTIDDAQVFAAVARQLSRDGATTLQAVVAETGVSVGSLYHRYGSREGLLAHTWLDAVRAFHKHILPELERDADDAGARVALATPRFCRSEPDRSIVLACCRRAEFLTGATPAALRAEIEGVNAAAATALLRFAKRTGHSIDACRLGLVAIPLGAVRLYLPDRPVPASIDDYVLAACRAVMRTERSKKS